MDLRLLEAEPNDEEREAIDARLSPAASGGEGSEREASHFAAGLGRERRHLLLPALQSVQSRVGWISEGALNYVCKRLGVPPADAYGVATFYALLSMAPRPRRVLHVCDDIACRCRGANELIQDLERTLGSPAEHGPERDHVELDENGVPTSLQVTFEQHCGGAGAALFGQITY